MAACGVAKCGGVMSVLRAVDSVEEDSDEVVEGEDVAWEL